MYHALPVFSVQHLKKAWYEARSKYPYLCKDISQLNLQTMKMVMFSSFNFSLELIFQLNLKEENITIFISVSTSNTGIDVINYVMIL